MDALEGQGHALEGAGVRLRVLAALPELSPLCYGSPRGVAGLSCSRVGPTFPPSPPSRRRLALDDGRGGRHRPSASDLGLAPLRPLSPSFSSLALSLPPPPSPSSSPPSSLDLHLDQPQLLDRHEALPRPPLRPRCPRQRRAPRRGRLQGRRCVVPSTLLCPSLTTLTCLALPALQGSSSSASRAASRTAAEATAVAGTTVRLPSLSSLPSLRPVLDLLDHRRRRPRRPRSRCAFVLLARLG